MEKVLSFQYYANHIPQNASYLRAYTSTPRRHLLSKSPQYKTETLSAYREISVTGLLCLPGALPQTILWQNLALPASVGPAPGNALACVNNWSSPGALVRAWAVAAAGCPLLFRGGTTAGLLGSFSSLAQSALRVFCQGSWVLRLRAYQGAQAPTCSHVHCGGLGRGGRRRGEWQDEVLQSPHDPGDWDGDPG